jgi:hypothetical protein
VRGGYSFCWLRWEAVIRFVGWGERWLFVLLVEVRGGYSFCWLRWEVVIRFVGWGERRLFVLLVEVRCGYSFCWLRWEAVIRFVGIWGNVDQHCLNFLFTKVWNVSEYFFIEIINDKSFITLQRFFFLNILLFS